MTTKQLFLCVILVALGIVLTRHLNRNNKESSVYAGPKTPTNEIVLDNGSVVGYFVDGDNKCYYFNNGTDSLSCIKNK